MNWIFTRLFGSAPSPQAAGWGTSVLVHAIAAVVASVAVVSVSATLPEMSGRNVDDRIDLLVDWTEPEPPSEPLRILPSDELVVVLPDRARVARQTFFRTSTDVSQPTPDELAMVDRMMVATPARTAQRRVFTTVEDPSWDRPLRADIASPPKASEVPAIGAMVPPATSRRGSVGNRELELPQLLENPPPVYPAGAVVDRLEGTVLLRVYVTAAGRVSGVEVAASSGHAVLDGAAVRAVRTWRFAPAERGGRPTAATVRLPVRFAL